MLVMLFIKILCSHRWAVLVDSKDTAVRGKSAYSERGRVCSSNTRNS